MNMIGNGNFDNYNDKDLVSEKEKDNLYID